MPQITVTLLNAPRCNGGENPLWDDERQLLHYIDNSGMKVHSFDPETGTVRTLDMPSVITTLVLREGGGAVVTLRTGIHFLNLDTGATEPIHPLPDPPPHVYNDGKVDARGRFVIGASTANFNDPGPDGGLFRLDPDRTLSRIDGGIHFSNGPCWSPDWSTLYFADSWLRTIYAYDYDIGSGAATNRRIFATTDDLGGLPDGATVDAAGQMWVAIYRGGKVAAYDPDGSLVRTINLPTPLVSSVTFGGPRLDRLFATTIAHDLAANSDTAETAAGDVAGGVFVIDGLDAKGRAEPRFAG